MRQELVDFGHKWESFGYDVCLWTEKNLPELRNQALYDKLPEVGVNTGGGISELGVWVQRADIAAYELLYEYGGVYANTDIEPLKSFDRILNGVQAFAGWEIQDQFVCNALMGCVPQNRFFDLLIDMLLARWESLPGRPMNEQTGPHLLTAAHRANPGLTVFPQHYFYPYSYVEMGREWDEHPDSYASHHWGHTRGMVTE